MSARPEFSEFTFGTISAGEVTSIKQVDRFTGKTVQMLSADLNGTLQVQGSLTGSGADENWADIGSAHVGGGTPLTSLVEVPQTVQFLRIKITAHTAGVPAAHFGGFDQRVSS